MTEQMPETARSGANAAPGFERQPGDHERAVPSTTASSPTTEQGGTGAARAAISGVLAGAVALGVGELLSGLSNRIPSLIVAVADSVIDNVPGSIERWAIETLGENDKPALVIGVVVISLVIAAVTGLAARRRFRTAVLVFALFATIGGLAASADTQRSTALGWLAAALAGSAGLATLWLLLRRKRASGDLRVFAQSEQPERRSFVGAAAAMALLAGGTSAAGWLLRRRRANQIEADRRELAATIADTTTTDTDVDPSDNESSTTDNDSTSAVDGATPSESDAAAALAGLGIDGTFDDVVGIAELITPNDDFYRIDAAVVVPQIDVDSWSMKITGLVDRELEFTFNDLLAMDLVEEHVTLSCVSNEVGGDLVGNAKWLGVPLKRLLDEAGVRPEAAQIVGRSVDGWTGAFPTAYLDDPERVALVAVAMNDEPLPVPHGFPVRLVIAGLYGYVSATKWLSEVELVTADFDGFWITRGWSKLGPIKTQSRIDVPASNARLSAGPQPIAGVAWAPDRGIARVEVQVTTIVDGTEEPGPWVEARLSDDLADESWRQWMLPWDATPGDHIVRVRATDRNGETQTPELARPAPDGATGWHTITTRVS